MHSCREFPVETFFVTLALFVWAAFVQANRMPKE
jgi:hypothetical protein